MREKKKLIRRGDEKRGQEWEIAREQEWEIAREENSHADTHKEERESSVLQISAERNTSNKTFVSILKAGSGYFSLLAADMIYGAWEWNICVFFIIFHLLKF